MGNMRGVRIISAFLSLSAAAGCASYQPTNPPRAALPLPTEIQQYYSYQQIETTAVVRTTEQLASYTVKDVELPIPDSSEPIEIVWYEPTTREPLPLILISPIRGSDTLVVDGCARIFANRGYHAAIIKRPHYHFDPNGPLSQVENSLRTAVIRHRQALDWLLAQPNVDNARVATFGISYGGIIVAALAAVEPRPKINVIDLAGGPLPGVMKSSDEHSIRRDWNRSRRDHDLTNRQLYEALQKVVRTDPVKLAPYVARDQVLMLIARFDRSVPTQYQLKLWRALGRPRADFVYLGHYTSILAIPSHRTSILKFIEEAFDQQPATTPNGGVIQANNSPSVTATSQ
jgi:pimeloyl-ACP methyl ester carboxylesterase